MPRANVFACETHREIPCRGGGCSRLLYNHRNLRNMSSAGGLEDRESCFRYYDITNLAMRSISLPTLLSLVIIIEIFLLEAKVFPI